MIGRAGDDRIGELRKEVIAAVSKELQPLMERGGESSGPAGIAVVDTSAQLQGALAAIHNANAQSEILKALLEGAAMFGSRVALFVVKNNAANGWQARGFKDNAGIKKVSIESGGGLVAKAIRDRSPVSGSASDFDPDFAKSQGKPKSGSAHVMPLLVRDKVPAVLYADAGTESDGKVDGPALETLARSTGLWLEVQALRKAVAAEPAAEAAAETAEASPPPAVEEAPPPPPPPAAMSPQDEEVHKKAKKFAKLLVDEINLYNKAEVAEGRKNRDLYDRLREAIEKSRESYQKRYGNTVAAGAGYFNDEIIRVLAQNDASLLGANFQK
jgi:hypothetical protein